jgi:GR25 family glycosyltransferase involved in LPS biosynthesis
LILEDDAIFNPKDLRDTLEDILGHASLWDVCSLDTPSQPRYAIHKTQGKRVLECPTVRCDAATGYVLNRKAAALYLQKALPIKVPVDWYMSRPWEFGLRFFICRPQPLHQIMADTGHSVGSDVYSPPLEMETSPIRRTLWDKLLRKIRAERWTGFHAQLMWWIWLKRMRIEKYWHKLWT